MTDSQDMFQAIVNGDTPHVARLIRREPSLVNARNAAGDSPLITAAYRGRGEIVDLLLEHGAKLNLYEAATLGRIDDVRAILNAEPTFLTSFSHDGWTPLHLAAHFQRKDVAELLILSGADVNAQSSQTSLAQGNTPLHAACASGSEELVGLLLHHGADPNAVQANGMTPLHIGAAGPNVTVVRYLLEAGADCKTEDAAGLTALDLAVKYGRDENAQLLRSSTESK